jgi:hypothetical protein
MKAQFRSTYKTLRLLAPFERDEPAPASHPTQLKLHLAENEDDVLDLIAEGGEYRLACRTRWCCKSASCEVAERRTTGGLLRVENRACSAPRLLLCLGQRDELLHVTWHRVEPTAGPLLLRLLDALWPG